MANRGKKWPVLTTRQDRAVQILCRTRPDQPIRNETDRYFGDADFPLRLRERGHPIERNLTMSPFMQSILISVGLSLILTVVINIIF